MALIKPIGWKTGPGSSCSLGEKAWRDSGGLSGTKLGAETWSWAFPLPCMSQASQGGELGSHSKAGIRYSYRAFQKLDFEAMGFRDKDFSSIPFI